MRTAVGPGDSALGGRGDYVPIEDSWFRLTRGSEGLIEGNYEKRKRLIRLL